MATSLREEMDTLSSLEERVLKAVELVAELRQERDIVIGDLEAALTAKEAALQEIETQKTTIAELHEHIRVLQGEQAVVKERIQKVLGQLDQLSVS